MWVSTNWLEFWGYEKRPPMTTLSNAHDNSWNCTLLSLAYFKFGLMLFNWKHQRWLVVGKWVLSDHLRGPLQTNLFSSFGQMISSHVVSLSNFKNLYSQFVYPKAKEVMHNWIEVYHMLKKFIYMFELNYWFDNALLNSNFTKLINYSILIIDTLFLKCWWELFKHVFFMFVLHLFNLMNYAVYCN